MRSQASALTFPSAPLCKPEEGASSAQDSRPTTKNHTVVYCQKALLWSFFAADLLHSLWRCSSHNAASLKAEQTHRFF